MVETAPPSYRLFDQRNLNPNPTSSSSILNLSSVEVCDEEVRSSIELEPVSEKSKLKVGLYTFLKQLYHLLSSHISKKGQLTKFILLILLLFLVSEVLGYWSGLITSNFYLVLNLKDLAKFKLLIFQSTLLVVGSALTSSILNWFLGKLSLFLRSEITGSFHHQYLGDTKHFFQTIDQQKVPNPEQRVTQDVERLATCLSKISLPFLTSPLVLIYYSIQLYSITGSLGLVSIYGYFLLTVVLSQPLLGMVAEAVNRQEDEEAKFRKGHHFLVDHFNSIALERGTRFFKLHLDTSLNQLIQRQNGVVNSELFTFGTSKLFSYLGSILCYSLIAIPLFNGKYDHMDTAELSKTISMTAFISMTLIYKLSLLMEQFTQLADTIGYTTRLFELDSAFNSKTTSLDSDTKFHYDNTLVEPARIKLDKVTLKTPDNKVIFKDFSLTITQNQPVLITGPNGCGKTSLTLALAQLLPTFQGSITFPKLNSFQPNCSFQAQPTLPQTSLRSLLSYPNLYPAKLTDLEIDSLLSKAGLTFLKQLTQGYDTVQPTHFWLTQLTSGQQQKLAILRHLIHQPTFLVLDESTSRMDPQTERDMLLLLQQHQITVVLISHSHQNLDLFEQIVKF